MKLVDMCPIGPDCTPSFQTKSSSRVQLNACHAVTRLHRLAVLPWEHHSREAPPQKQPDECVIFSWRVSLTREELGNFQRIWVVVFFLSLFFLFSVLFVFLRSLMSKTKFFFFFFRSAAVWAVYKALKHDLEAFKISTPTRRRSSSS